MISNALLGAIRVKIGVVIFGILASFALMAGIWNLASSQQLRAHFGHQVVGFTVQQQREIIRACDKETGEVAYKTCVGDALGDGLTAVREVADLQAQQSMAQWAAIMAFVAAAQLGLSAAGAYFVWRTLQQQLQANTITRNVGIAQTRAYVGIDGPNRGFKQ
ncbi:hypothetical protein JP75_22950 [Devosia riboflavina]|uniref:Uncharacterized protein n=1 Tax=Devosia riboflavina TaxID=46914 RepID=A0A087LWU1_9HYPH|nr:hypothetical protein JP75_22950 [Devosia riboflavina]